MLDLATCSSPPVPHEVVVALVVVGAINPLGAAVSPAAQLSGRAAMAATEAPRSPDRSRSARADPHAQLREPGELRELRGLVIARGPLRRALAGVAGQLVATRAWERLGFARLRDYAVERTGHSARSLQDLARVDAALAGLPRVKAALVEGELTWTKARLLCRVASVDDEALWVAFAREKTARALSREVRAVDVGALESGAATTDEDGVPEEECETVQLRCTPAVRARWWRARQLSRRVAGEALPVWGCMEAIAAEVLSALPLEVEVEPVARAALSELAPQLPETPLGAQACAALAPAANGCAGQGASGESGREPQVAPARAANGCAGQGPCDESGREPGVTPAPQAELPPFLASLVVGLESADAFALDERLRRAVALEQRLEAEMGPLLLRIAEGRLHRAAGFTTMDEYAREQLGISPRKARALLRLERAGRRARLLREAYRDGRLSWVQAHALLPLLAIASAHQRCWIDWACIVTVRRLQEDVERARVLHGTDPPRFEKTGGLPAEARSESEEREARELRAAHGEECEEAFTEGGAAAEVGEAAGAAEGATASRNRQTGAKPTRTDETCRIFWNGPRDVARLFRAVLCTVRRHIERRTGRLPSDGEALDAMLEHVFEAWTSGVGMGVGVGVGMGVEIGIGMGEARVRAAHRVFARDGWRCTVPGCSSYRELHDHHIRFRSAGGSDAESNRTTLCAWHHLRGVHAGPARLRLRGRAPRRLHFELGLRPGAPALLRYDADDRLRPPAPTAPVFTVNQSCEPSDFLKKSAGVDDNLPSAIEARNARDAIKASDAISAATANNAINKTNRRALSWQHDACSGVGG